MALRGASTDRGARDERCSELAYRERLAASATLTSHATILGYSRSANKLALQRLSRVRAWVLTMSENEQFLELSFAGGRFVQHTAPVDVMAELGLAQQLLAKVARHLYFEANPERQRLPRGFLEASQLHLASTARNCFSATLVRPKADASTVTLFGDARDVSIQTLHAIAKGEHIPKRFPTSALTLLAAWGKRLESEESLVVRGVGDGALSAEINQASRERLAELIKRPLERVEDVEGEVVQLDDANDRILVRTRLGDRIELPFDISQRKLVMLALDHRPVARVRARGALVMSGSVPQKMRELEELEVIDDERAAEAQRVWDRLESFERIDDGWFEGDGLRPTTNALSVARGVLARLIVEHHEIVRPRVFPTPVGGVQAEWITGKWAADICFDPTDGSIAAGATSETGEELSAFFGTKEVSVDSVEPLANWLDSLN